MLTVWLVSDTMHVHNLVVECMEFGNVLADEGVEFSELSIPVRKLL